MQQLFGFPQHQTRFDIAEVLYFPASFLILLLDAVQLLRVHNCVNYALYPKLMFLVFSIPDTYQVFSKKMSTTQYAKNMSSLAASFLASVGGTAAAGALIGEKISGKGKAKVVGLVAGGACGLVAGVAVKTVGNLLHEDDAVITTRLFNAVLTNMIIDHMLSESEVDLLIKELDNKGKELADLQKALLSSKSQASDISDFLLPIVNDLTDNREKVDEKCSGKFMDSIAELLMNGDLAYGV